MRGVAKWGLDALWNPLCEHFSILVFEMRKLFFNFASCNLSSKNCMSWKVFPTSRICWAHHVVCIKHSLSNLRGSLRSFLWRISWCMRCKTTHKEMETRERDETDRQFCQITIELTRKSETACDSWHESRYQVIKIPIGGTSELKSSEADAMESFIVNAHDLVRIFNHLAECYDCIVSFKDQVWESWRRQNSVCANKFRIVFFLYLWNHSACHSRACASSQSVGDLETLKWVTLFNFASNSIH